MSNYQSQNQSRDQAYQENNNNNYSHNNSYSEQQQQPQPVSQMNQEQYPAPPATAIAATRSPYTEPLRWVLFILLVLGTGAGVTSHVLTNPQFSSDKNVMWT